MAQRLELKEPIPYLSIVMLVIILIDAYSFNTRQHQCMDARKGGGEEGALAPPPWKFKNMGAPTRIT